MVRTISEAGNLWELAVLSLLREEPMHPYQMRRLLEQRHKDEVLALRKGSLYHAIDRLTRAGLIAAVKVEREGRRPERTRYRLTRAGDLERVRWLRERIATPPEEPLAFVATLNFLVYLEPKDAAAQLEARAAALEARARSLEGSLAHLATFLDRINLIESEYLLAATRAERAWVRAVIADLRAGRLRWDLTKILKKARADRRAAGREKGR